MCGTSTAADERGAADTSSSPTPSSSSILIPGGGSTSSSATRLQHLSSGGTNSGSRMPASSSDDPVSNALHMSLLANKCSTLKCNSNGGEGGSSEGASSLDNKLVASTKRVLLTEIPFEKCSSYTSTVLDSLKQRYIVLNTNDTTTCGGGGGGGGKVSKCGDETGKKTKVVGGGGTCEDGLPKPKIVLYSADSVQLGWQGSAPVGAGMVNLRNTCYLNSTLQALFHVPSFVNWLLNDKSHVSKCQLLNGLTHSECLICAMKSVLIAHRSTNNAIKPILIYSKLKLICKHFVHGQQEDAHEFLRYLIESMERSYLNVVGGLKLDSYSKETTPLNQIFGGYLRTEVTCLVCGHVSTTFQHFEDLPLDIRQVSSVEAALDTYFSREQLGVGAGGGDEAYKCDKCHRRVNATKKFSLQRAPNVLCLQLKRFGITGGKMSKHISLQMSLDMTRYMHASTAGGRGRGRSYRYRLVSMISHIGPWSGCGHYTAMAAASNGSGGGSSNTSGGKLMQNGGSNNGELSKQQSSYFSASPSGGGSSKVLPLPAFITNSSSTAASAAVTTSPPKQERASSSSSSSSTTPASCSSSASSSSSSCPSPSSVQRHQNNSSSSVVVVKQQQQNNNNNNCSNGKKLNGTKQQRLVPYTTTESDDSSTEEEAEAEGETKRSGGGKFARPDCLKKLEIDCGGGHHSSTSSTWHVTEVGSQHQQQQHSASSISSVSSSGSCSSGVGNWSVTDSSARKAVARTSDVNGSREALPIGQLTEQHVLSAANKTWSHSNGERKSGGGGGKMWDGSRGGETDATVNGLLKMSHRGYGGTSGDQYIVTIHKKRSKHSHFWR
ncbi:hypothetical protein LSTR_LSTR015607 [Laodelphax striatellus]|uniref:Ubiquitin carboxyl-terminal hydrolase 36 n=1 Tax=Laodelphax striatellus TaxID=195883 RepID=A0A482WN52_LAOST|nr:hypothetical protein LSTR_LSTR015607 [Laodelphax striatellus]